MSKDINDQRQNRICYQICNNAANHTINLGPKVPQNTAYLSLEIGAYIDNAPPNDCRAITKSYDASIITRQRIIYVRT